MWDFIKEKKGTIGLILVVLSFFFVAIFLFTKEGRTPDRIINVLETDESELVSRDTYKEFIDAAADAYKLNHDEDPHTLRVRQFMKKKAQKDKGEDKDQVEDHGRNTADIGPFDAKTLAQLDLESIYTSEKDGFEREAVIRRIKEIHHHLTQQQLEDFAALLEDHKDDISKVKKLDITKISEYVDNIEATQLQLKQQATSLLELFKKMLLANIPESIVGYLKKWRPTLFEIFDDIADWQPLQLIDLGVALLLSALRYFVPLKEDFEKVSENLSGLGTKTEALFTSYQLFEKAFIQQAITPQGTPFLFVLYIVTSMFRAIVKKDDDGHMTVGGTLNFIGIVVAIIVLAACLYRMVKKSTGGILTMFFALPFVGAVVYGVCFKLEYKKPVTVGPRQKISSRALLVADIFSTDGEEAPTGAYKYFIKLYYFFQFKLGVLKGGTLFTLLFRLYVLLANLNTAFQGVLFLNNLKRITKGMEALHKAYQPKKEKHLPYFEDIAEFIDNTATYALMRQAPTDSYLRQRLTALYYGVFLRSLHNDIDKVIRDQKYKKALSSFLVLYKIKDQLDAQKGYTLLKKSADNDTQAPHPIIHTEAMQRFFAKPKAAYPASENEAKDDKSSLTYNVNLGRDKSRAYLLVGDDESVMKDYLICIGQNVLYTQSMGVMRGKSKHYNAPDIVFYADGYEDTREAHAARLANVLTYAKQHTDEKILVLVSNIAGKMSGVEHAAFVHSYAAELKKLSNVTFVFSTNNVQHMYQVIDMQKMHFTLLTPLLKNQKPTGSITIGRSKGHMQGVKMLSPMARNFRQLLKRNPNYQGHLQDHVSKEYSSSILFFIFMTFMILGLMLFRKRKK